MLSNIIHAWYETMFIFWLAFSNKFWLKPQVINNFLFDVIISNNFLHYVNNNIVKLSIFVVCFSHFQIVVPSNCISSYLIILLKLQSRPEPFGFQTCKRCRWFYGIIRKFILAIISKLTKLKLNSYEKFLKFESFILNVWLSIKFNDLIIGTVYV